ncbi:unnamed protein product [Medioppia subpectinata]|uniref:Uncharacterized protein n=1 Tax=Medioppia subpectinata TaxID=1979941 RepID=A0A7R9PXA7_9ACAR|nr:unnamed protein product [Medioppia subpectinata]CAG2104606.1 unnamed protein product [Medioppia subpectinata]
MHNIVRPVAYFELRVFYRKYLLSTMELKFWANIVLVFSAYKIMNRLVRAMVSGDNHTINTRSLYLLAYIVWSVLSLTAYLVVPMASYGRAANVMIVGEFFAAFGLLLVLCRSNKSNNKFRL